MGFLSLFVCRSNFSHFLSPPSPQPAHPRRKLFHFPRGSWSHRGIGLYTWETLPRAASYYDIRAGN